MGNPVALLMLLAAFLAAHAARFGHLRPETGYLLALLVGMLAASVVLPATGAFRREFRWDVMRKVRRLVAGWAIVVTALVALASMLKVTEDYSRIWFGYWVIFGAIALVAAQFVEAAWRRRPAARARRRRLVLVGAGDAAARAEARLDSPGNHDLQLVERFGEAWSGEPARPVAELADYVSDHGIQDVWIAVPLAETKILEAALDALRESLVDVHVVPDLHQYRMLNQNISEWAGLPVISLSGTPMTGAEMRLKTTLDYLGAAVLVAVLFPLLLLIALAIRLESRGPALFRQPRHGLGGETITVLKFRTMREHAESEGQVTQARPGDARVTHVGRWLRRTSLDELPQLFNVLGGQMSLVGPRPHATAHNRLYRSRIPRYMLRHKVRPGITGWAQVNGLRGLTDTDEKMSQRIEHDLWYIQNWSLWLDIRILLMTPLAMVHRNAF